MITYNWNCTSQRRKRNQTLEPEKSPAQVKSLLCGLLWEKKISHKAVSSLLTAEQVHTFAASSKW